MAEASCTTLHQLGGHPVGVAFYISFLVLSHDRPSRGAKGNGEFQSHVFNVLINLFLLIIWVLLLPCSCTQAANLLCLRNRFPNRKNKYGNGSIVTVRKAIRLEAHW